jgi:uncharacterized BrkB/YihY/UPF0761 family membrane protein
MKLINRLINFLTYTGAICFLMSIMIVGELGVKMVLSKIPVYFPTHKHDEITEWLLWGGFMFVLLMSQQVLYKVWKNHIKIEVK